MGREERQQKKTNTRLARVNKKINNGTISYEEGTTKGNQILDNVAKNCGHPSLDEEGWCTNPACRYRKTS